jgi:hypothetical protein
VSDLDRLLAERGGQLIRAAIGLTGSRDAAQAVRIHRRQGSGSV